jgi:hypothetical protein
MHSPFNEARGFVHGLALKSATKWREFCRSGKKPADIPANPARTYRGKGWQGWGDWLGTGTTASKNIIFRPYDEARDFVQGLGLKSSTEWREYCRSGNIPADIPRDPASVYKGEGWTGFCDWLGTDNTI